jgi:parallel beta-helix repeat protein
LHALSGNVVRDSGGRGIRLNQVSGSRLSGNPVTGSTDTGIEIGGDANHIEDNLLWFNGDFGLVINGVDNVYRGNTARQNTPGTCSGSGTTDFCDNGTNNSSPGDNFLPGLM